MVDDKGGGAADTGLSGLAGHFLQAREITVFIQRLLNQGLYDLRIYRIVPSSNYARNGTVLAYAHTRPADALYRSTDRGQSWSLVTRQVEYNTPPLPKPNLYNIFAKYIMIAYMEVAS